jgi:hypothetical protein
LPSSGTFPGLACPQDSRGSAWPSPIIRILMLERECPKAREHPTPRSWDGLPCDKHVGGAMLAPVHHTGACSCEHSPARVYEFLELSLVCSVQKGERSCCGLVKKCHCCLSKDSLTVSRGREVIALTCAAREGRHLILGYSLGVRYNLPPANFGVFPEYTARALQKHRNNQPLGKWVIDGWPWCPHEIR